MMFSSERRTVAIDGQDLILVELSAGDFVTIQNADESEAHFLMVHLSLESPKTTLEDLKKWPNRIVNQLALEAMDLNGIGAEGN